MRPTDLDVREHRTPDHPIEDLILGRWSPRAMSGEALEEAELMRLFEAARWAPSSYNGQPWRFLYARRDTPAWDRFFDLLVEFNQGWAQNAAVLVVVVSRKTFEHNDKPAKTHSFDAGSSWMALALQGSAQGLVVHGMQGFDYEEAAQVLGVPDDHTVEAMVAIGKPGEIEDLDEDLQGREEPSGRKKVEEIAFEGSFPAE